MDLFSEIDVQYQQATTPPEETKGSSGAKPKRRKGNINKQENNLSVHNATWFLELMEQSELAELAPEERAKIIESKLRNKPKHRTAILFSDDVKFVLHTPHDLTLDQVTKKKSFPRTDVRVLLLREACRRVINAYELSIQNAPLRSCVWSALMYRAEYHLQQSGFEDIYIVEHNNTNKEATFNVQGHEITRSNFTKIARHFCDSAEKREGLKNDDG
eukprot:CAMPEP_0203761416 /NCGR_PEP_ID=MMETSP0098-20131031/14506_1 /ASSEMBLY_ACC=CAM_ASM_000208 /TAXON_ID=96639 /ORGANISM=" , Strain NY0313808BC1" /LENGTH=215 /DNA_ID=CAMNT_0050655401 /DNA_START=335 /DNA_END=982 /DNA_ORIENTATION=+